MSHLMASLFVSLWTNAIVNLSVKSTIVPNDGVGWERAFFVKVDAHIWADPSFIKDRAKAIFLVSVS